MPQLYGRQLIDTWRGRRRMKAMTKPNILDVVVFREGFDLQQKGRNYWGLCPLHAEKTASFVVNPEKQRFKCFGCGESGDVVDFVQKYRNISFKDALGYLNISNDIKPVKQDPQETRLSNLLKAFDKWADSYSRECCELIRVVNYIDFVIAPEVPEILEIYDIYIIREIAAYHLEILESDDIEAKIELWREV